LDIARIPCRAALSLRPELVLGGRSDPMPGGFKSKANARASNRRSQTPVCWLICASFAGPVLTTPSMQGQWHERESLGQNSEDQDARCQEVSHGVSPSLLHGMLLRQFCNLGFLSQAVHLPSSWPRVMSDMAEPSSAVPPTGVSAPSSGSAPPTSGTNPVASASSSSSTLPSSGTKTLAQMISELRQQQQALRTERLRVARDLRNTRKRAARIKRRAAGLSEADLMHLVEMKKQKPSKSG
jgi:hypothetical protein